jgi:hypothetical protein
MLPMKATFQKAEGRRELALVRRLWREMPALKSTWLRDNHQNRIARGPQTSDTPSVRHSGSSLLRRRSKNNRWLSPSTTWNTSWDQFARNVEAAWSLAESAGKEYRLHEYPLKHHEASLLKGYPRGTWSAGWPHISEEHRREFFTRIGTLTWAEIVREWPQLQKLPKLRDLHGKLG